MNISNLMYSSLIFLLCVSIFFRQDPISIIGIELYDTIQSVESLDLPIIEEE